MKCEMMGEIPQSFQSKRLFLKSEVRNEELEKKNEKCEEKSEFFRSF